MAKVVIKSIAPGDLVDMTQGRSTGPGRSIVKHNGEVIAFIEPTETPDGKRVYQVSTQPSYLDKVDGKWKSISFPHPVFPGQFRTIADVREKMNTTLPG